MRKLIFLISVCLILINGNIIAQQDSVWTLQKCIERAFTQNIQIRKGENSNQKYELYVDQAKAQRLPSASASLSHNFDWSKSTAAGSSGFSGVNGSNYSLNSGVTIFNASKLNNEIKQSVLDLEGGKYSLETTKEAISLSILDAYLQVLYAEELVKNSQKQIESTAEELRLAGERLALQSISISDYAQVKSQLASEKLTLANAENTLSIDKINLMQLMDLPVQADFKIAQPEMQEKLNQGRVPDVKKVYETALSIKPQVKNAAVNKEIASLDEKIAKASYYPVLSASAGMNSSYSTRGSGSYFGQLNDGVTPSVGFSLSVPIFQKKQVKTSIAVAKIGYNDAELSEIDTKNTLRKSIEQACLDVTSAQTKYEASLENYNSYKESSALSEEKFKQGIINSVDYLVAKTNLIVAESEFLQAKYNLIFSYKTLDFYMGIPLSL